MSSICELLTVATVNVVPANFPPEAPPDPLQAAVPRSAAPTTPAPVILKKSLLVSAFE
ncbi:MAG TPA: hypothetical protein VF711_11035 [Acidimicrobiales bacterium]